MFISLKGNSTGLVLDILIIHIIVINITIIDL